ncbi:cadherin-related family member 5 isoform X2 [Microtus ochrogaster]|uniref:Cadherin-related family member 5 isoform X2 n=1 Tax=Microtus ochrogaster TaxID=79684 RepID=A0ABM0KRU3_MICOH|nr:cadherin-related family member 5 isoform X2 [Microtus ochrogaster]
MGAPALLWPLLLPPLLLVLFGQPPGTSAQDQVCSVNKPVVQIKENSSISEPLLNISVSDGLHVTLGSGSTPSTFKIVGNQLFLIVTPDYEENSMLEAVLECKRGNEVVTALFVPVIILDINDNPPKFPFTTKEYSVSEDTRVGTVVIPGTELAAEDPDKDDTLYYTLQEVTPNASSFFSLAGLTNPALTLSRTLDFYKNQKMTFRLLAQDTWNADSTEPSHTATATLIVNVLPADLRTPWFLPCSFSDGYFCIQAQYHGVVPTGLLLSSPLILSPGPIYAVDGDQGINRPIIYSIMAGNTDDTFIIDEKSGNLTMSKSIPSPMTFTLLVRADQDDMVRYSVTQAVVEARDVSGNPLQFSQSLYHGTVVLGSEAGTAVKDRTSPSENLRIQAQYSDFPDLNSDITYRITNSSDFRMDKDVMLTNETMKEIGIFYVQVEATGTVTNDTATTVVEIQVSEQEAPSTGEGAMGDHKFSTVDMAVLGGVLGALLLLALIGLVILIHKHYRHRFNCCCKGKAKVPPPQNSYDNLTFLPDHKASWSSTSNPQPQPDPEPSQPPSGSHSPLSSSPTPPSSAPPSPELRASGSPKTVQAGDSPSAVKSILTKERRPEGEGGYKAVWFGKDIREDADVVVLNEPTADMASASATESEGSDDDEPDQKKGLHLGADIDHTYI